MPQASSTMKMRVLYFLVTLMASWEHVYARNIFIMENTGKSTLEYVNSRHGSATVDLTSEEDVPSAEGLPPEFVCRSCMEVSRKVEEVLTDTKFLERAGIISSKVCQMMPSDLQVKCLEMSEMYVHQTISFLQEYFREENLCNSTGLCTGDTEATLSTGIACQSGFHSWFLTQIRLHRFTNKISDEKSCTACHDAMNEILEDLKDHETKIEVLKILLKACKGMESHVKECKKLVFEYGPLILANIEKFVTNNDLCSLVRLCDGAVPHTEERMDDGIPFIALPHTKSFGSEPAWMIM